MLLTLHTNAVRSLVKPSRGEPALDLADLPRFAREEFGLYGLNLTTDLFAGAVRSRLERIRESADKAGCACLVLIEQDALPLADADDDKALGGVERIERVIRAAQILGCNSIAFRISGRADEPSLERAVEHLKEATEKAERHEVNLLISPMDGLTAEPERVTSIIKKVGGFRVGTFPDFEVAARAADPVTYLRRLTPYAAAVCAATMEFVDAPEEGDLLPPPAEKPKKPKKSAKDEDESAEAPADESEAGEDSPPTKGKKTKKSKAKGKDADDAPSPGEEAAPAAKGKKSKAKASAPPPEPAADDEEADEEELKKLGEEMGLVPDEAWAELEQMLEEIPPPPVHRPYSLDQMVAAVLSVGYDGTLAIDYRGKGDVTVGILNSRAALEAAIRAANE